jgi:hypothetical protein
VELINVNLKIFSYKQPNMQEYLRRISSSGMLRRVILVRMDNSEERGAFIIRVTKISEVGTTLTLYNVVPCSPILFNLMMRALSPSET